MPVFNSSPAYEESTKGPTGTAAELQTWWRRDVWVGYTVIKVKVLFPETPNGKLHFHLAEEAHQASARKFEVDLLNNAAVWGERPSTAQFATSDRPFGFLLVSKDWAEKSGIDLKISGGGKWPISTALAYLKGLRQAVKDDKVRAGPRETSKDEALRTKLLEGLDALEQLAAQHADSDG